MPTLKEHLFQETISRSLNRLRSEFRDKYKPKKDNRFESHGITYEIGSPLVTREGVVFEISSKIPLDILSSRATKEKYFKAIKDIISKKGKAPLSVDMENIVTSLSLSEKKERDYVKAKYIYSENELYDNSEITKKVDKFKKNPENIPVIPGVTTLFGRLVLQSVEEQIYKKAKENIISFINANEEIRKKYS